MQLRDSQNVVFQLVCKLDASSTVKVIIDETGLCFFLFTSMSKFDLLFVTMKMQYDIMITRSSCAKYFLEYQRVSHQDIQLDSYGCSHIFGDNDDANSMVYIHI